MAEESGSDESPDEVKLEIARSRGQIDRDLRGLRYELDFPGKIRRSFHEQTGVWIAVAALVGTAIVALPRSKKTVYVTGKKGAEEQKKGILQAGLLLGVLRFAATLARPALINFIKERMTGPGGPFRGGSKW